MDLETPGKPTKKRRKSQRPMPKTLIQRRDAASKAGASPIAATIVHIVADRHLAEAHEDPFYLALLLVTFLVYLYTRRWEWVLVAFVVYYALENLLFFAAKAFHGYVGSFFHKYESRTDELLTDPIVFALALLAAGYVYELSAFQVAAVPAGAARTLAVALVALLAGFSRLYTVASIALVATIWIVYFTQTSVPGALEQALAATVTALGLFLWFLRPINRHYIFNALYALFYTTFFTAILTGIAMNI